MIRLATQDDLDALTSIYAAARAYMAKTGNATQWGTTKPTLEETKESIDKQLLYVGCSEDNIPHFAFVLAAGEDPTYGRIDGAWLNDEPYLTIHRVASDGTLRGVFSHVIAFALEQASKQGISNLRIDTHNNNLTMQHCILKNGFVHCGTIYLEDGDPRLAYQRNLKS